MADFASALHARLTADAAVSAVVAKRVYWVVRPQGSILPAIRLQTVSDFRSQHLGGYDGARTTRVQADCFATSYGAARQLAEKVIAALAQPATAGGVQFGRTKAEGPRDLDGVGETISGSSAEFIYRASLDLLVEHRLA